MLEPSVLMLGAGKAWHLIVLMAMLMVNVRMAMLMFGTPGQPQDIRVNAHGNVHETIADFCNPTRDLAIDLSIAVTMDVAIDLTFDVTIDLTLISL